jgi:hypothetical protein
MVLQESADDTLLPPNFITTHRDVEIAGVEPRLAPSMNSASAIPFVVTSFRPSIQQCPAAKKNPPG